ncbi:hypothetical protein [Halobacillus amylolyticus]|uniref:Uncharacterized protein n=1 Tax=Halobacillus amylolyticus TaxID=2932259 RepID=A0ABY4HD60_9BACI|nr:hypothetical protein [Halobacillus amylolyticus]UOR12835.1 hypothetical protein MUO15_04795 [Halobacillus amylolyticus]
MNWLVIKDTKWLVFQLTSMLLAAIGITLAVVNNSYWVLFGVFSMLLMFFAVNRASKMTK